MFPFCGCYIVFFAKFGRQERPEKPLPQLVMEWKNLTEEANEKQRLWEQK